MTRFTDIFIRRPVFATVVSLLIFFVGLRAMMDLQVRQYPEMTNTVITVTTAYPGAPAKLVEGFITTRLERSISGAGGIDYLTSDSQDGVSTISAYIKLNFNPDTAFTNVMAKVAEEKGFLPRESEDPVIQKKTGETTALMYIGFSSREMTRSQITDYLSRVVQPKLQTISGVAEAQVLGSATFAMRLWLNPQRMAALKVTAQDVRNALLANNFQAAAGSTKGEYVAIALNASTAVVNKKQFENLIIRHGESGELIRISDVATVELGAENYDASVYFNGVEGVFIGMKATPEANPLTVITDVKKALPGIMADFPPALKGKVVYDATKFIQASIHEVLKTIVEATCIVILVIFLFLGSLRTVLVPVVTIPLSLIGVCTLMLVLNYSFNLLTLLAMVLAIGMVVDDAIVVVENCYRHVEEGMPSFDAAIQGAREIALPVVSMTITLAAVYAPIGFMGGLTGGLFKEFAFTLASTVIISGVIALTLSPMMCSKLIVPSILQSPLVQRIDGFFSRLKENYQNLLSHVLQAKNLIVAFAFIVLISCFLLFKITPKELAPKEDQGAVFSLVTGPQYATIDYMTKFMQQLQPILRGIEAREDDFVVIGRDGVSTGFAGLILKPWQERKVTQEQVLTRLQEQTSKIAGLQIQSFPRPSLPTGGSGLPVQFVLTSVYPHDVLFPMMTDLVKKAKQSGLFLFVDGSLRYNKPQVNIEINRSKTAQMGVNMTELANTLSLDYGEGFVNWFNLAGRSYKVIPQVKRSFRLNPQQILDNYVRIDTGQLVPLSTFATLAFEVGPNSISHFQQLNSASINGVMAPGKTVSQGIEYLQGIAKQILPNGVSIDYAGESRQYVEEGSALVLTFIFSVIIIFLVLSAQFESFRDPLVIMISVPMAICGALLPMNWGLASINIYTQIGLITLIGLISKHGILMVDFANHLRDEKQLTPLEAIQQAAGIRLRPILMTTFSMILGVVPLILASGAGAASRFDIGLVIASGMAIGTLFTLFVLPVVYLLRTHVILSFLLAVGFVSFLLYQLLFVIFQVPLL